MRVIQITGYGDVDQLALRELPDRQPGPGEVLIAVKAFGINFADVLARVGLYVQAPKPPFTPGFEAAGVVMAVGSGVNRVQPGDRVVCLNEFGCYADQVVAREMGVCRIPDGLSFVEAAALPTVGATAYHALMRQGGLAAGETVLIQAAAGALGLTAVQMAQAAGARVIASCGGARKVAFLKERFGLEHVIDYRAEDLPARVRAVCGSAGLDVILDSVGGAFVKTGMELLAPGGRFIAIGAATFSPERKRNLWQLVREYLKTPRLHPLTLLGQSKSYIGVQMLVLGRPRPEVVRSAMEATLQMAEAGTLKPVLDLVLPADRIGEAHRRLQSRESIGKLVVTWP